MGERGAREISFSEEHLIMWKQPWGYAEGWVICAGLLITGFGLQLITGPVQAGLFQYPVNVAGG